MNDRPEWPEKTDPDLRPEPALCILEAEIGNRKWRLSVVSETAGREAERRGENCVAVQCYIIAIVVELSLLELSLMILQVDSDWSSQAKLRLMDRTHASHFRAMSHRSMCLHWEKLSAYKIIIFE